LKITHLVPGVDEKAPRVLRDEHARALESISNAAQRHLGGELEIKVVEVCDASWPATKLPGVEVFRKRIDSLSLGDEAGIRPKLRSFFPEELLSDAGTVVFTNADICVMPEFYEGVAELIRGGVEAGSIHRRTVLGVDATRPESVEAAIKSSNWYLHPGSDCFFFPASNARAMRQSEVVLGVPPVGRLMVQVLSALNPSYKKFPDTGLTFHFGDDRLWQSSKTLRNLKIRNRRNWLLSLPRVLSIAGPAGFIRGMKTIGVSTPRKCMSFFMISIKSLIWDFKPRL
jgi:hypothetical protein